MPGTVTSADRFRVDTATHLLGGLVWNRRGWWVRLGNLETRHLAAHLAAVEIKQPVFIAGLARSGTTTILEYLARHDGVATHRYRDYPFLFTPYWWNTFLDRTPRAPARAVERAHGDGIAVTPDSPEAMEEMLWMTFFPNAHNAESDAVIGATARNPAFEKFYRDHVRKVLLLRKGTRYAAKNNYNPTRLGYLRSLFPDCRIVIPVREPTGHVASLMRQHELFLAGERAHPRSLDYMRRVGHYEFGLDRRAVNAGDHTAARSVAELWAGGDELRGWARYWALIYGHVAATLETDVAVRESSRVVLYGDLCARPAKVLGTLSGHCALRIDQTRFREFTAGIRYPAYYSTPFTARDLDVIREETEVVASRIEAVAAR